MSRGFRGVHPSLDDLTKGLAGIEAEVARAVTSGKDPVAGKDLHRRTG
jgi:hypothetical protein